MESSNNTNTNDSDGKDPHLEAVPISNVIMEKRDSPASIQSLGNAEKKTTRIRKTPEYCDDALIGQRVPWSTVQRGHWVLLVFADQRHVMAEVGKPVKINKRTYKTNNLIGLRYGTLLEILPSGNIKVLPDTEPIVPPLTHFADEDEVDMPSNHEEENVEEENVEASSSANIESQKSSSKRLKREEQRDNRNIVDNNKSQALSQTELLEMRQTTAGHTIVQELLRNSATFASKTDFSRAKYIAKKQLKYQPRCRLVQCTASTVCEALFQKDAKRMSNLRPDTLGQLLSLANIQAGARVLVWEDLGGLITAAVAERLGGYGKLFSIYTGQQPCSHEVLFKFNFTAAQSSGLQWVHLGDVLNPQESATVDVEAQDRDAVTWPCPLQSHTKVYLKSSMPHRKQQEQFLDKRSARFTRKLTRPSPLESVQQLRALPVDSLIVAVRQYNVTETLQQLLPFLAPSCPFVVFGEYLEPLAHCFAQLQQPRKKPAIYLRLVSAWTRPYQILPGRTHPAMNMTQNGGYLLTGIKLHRHNNSNNNNNGDDEKDDDDDWDEERLQRIRATLPTRRGKKRKPPSTMPEGADLSSSKSTTTPAIIVPSLNEPRPSSSKSDPVEQQQSATE